MPRKGPAPKRPLVNDPVYGSQLVTQLVNKILLDGNHPLAGLALRIEYTVLDVRAADPDEIEAKSALLDSADAGLFMPGEK